MSNISYMLGFGTSPLKKFTTLFFRSESSSETTTITLPSDIQAGDLLVLCSRSGNPNTTIPPNVTPSGWTEVGTATDTNPSFSGRVKIDVKIALFTDASLVITGITGGDGNDKRCLVFKGDGRMTSVTPQDYAGVIANTAPSNQIANASGGTTPLVVIGTYGRRNGTIATREFTPAEDQEFLDEVNDSHYTKFKIYNSSPADTTIDHDETGVGLELQSCYLEVS